MLISALKVPNYDLVKFRADFMAVSWRILVAVFGRGHFGADLGGRQQGSEHHEQKPGHGRAQLQSTRHDRARQDNTPGARARAPLAQWAPARRWRSR
jgi:hypothetical protein